MAKIFIYIFSILVVTYLFPESISKQDLSVLKQNCIKLYNEKKYSESIPVLEKYLTFREEIQFKIYLAKSILYRRDLTALKEEDEIFDRKEKILVAINNYKKSSKIFSQVVPYLESVTPKDEAIAELYFLWAFSELFSDNKEKAISLFKKSARLNPELIRKANYNIAVIYEDLGQIKDSQIYFNKN